MAGKGLTAQFEGLSGLPVSRQISLMIVIAAAVAISVVIATWMRQPAWQTLFTPQSDREAAQLVAALSRANIDYQIERGSGAIQVSAAQHAEARHSLAGQGIGGAGRGFEMMDQQGYGTSQALENARLQKAMEGELERSISAMAGVASSRVHLAIPKRSPFVKKSQRPTASVLVSSLPGAHLDETVAASIARLVAASVPEMSPASVTVLDHQGRVLSGSGVSSAVALSDSQLNYTRNLEAQMVQRIESILIPIVGLQGVRAQVHAEVDFTEIEEAAEQFDPDRKTVRSQQSESQRYSAEGGVGGVPGALSNAPPGAEALQQGGLGGDSATSSVINYEVDRTVRHVRKAAGLVTRLSVAVLIDYRHADGGEPTPLAEEEMERIRSLVSEAVGLDQQRGDSLSLTNMRFLQPETVAVVAPPIWERGWVPGVIKQSLGVVALLVLVFMVLRPISRRLTEIPPPKVVPVRQEVTGDLAAEADRSSVTPQVNQLDMVRELASNDPKRVSQVMTEWIENDA